MVPPKTPAEEAVRTIDLDGQSCGHVMPTNAVSYSLQITTIDPTAPEKLPHGTGRVVRSSVVPAPAVRRLEFPVPHGFHLTVDVMGYYVPPGTAVTAASSAGASTEIDSVVTAQNSTAPKVGMPHTEDATGNLSGPDGDVFTIHQSTLQAGVILKAHAGTYPWVTVQGPTNDSGSGFSVYNQALAEIASFHSDGMVILGPNAYLSGRTDYHPGVISSGPYSIPQNIIHNAGVYEPRDYVGGGNNRVTFFNAEEWEAQGQEADSTPPLTKYHARTIAMAGKTNYNFDSEILYHTGSQYHFRAYAPSETKETFWVKAATNGDSLTGTRADMYVSGNVGIGTVNAGAALEVAGASKIALDPLSNRIWVSNGSASYRDAIYERLGIGYYSNAIHITSEAAGAGTLARIIHGGFRFEVDHGHAGARRVF